MGIRQQHVILVLALTLGNQVQAAEIYGGHEVIPHSRPHMVRLECLRENEDPSHCDGFLLNEDYVLTAAHCKSSSYYALLGLHNYLKNPEQRIFVQESYVHDDFFMNETELINDLMLLKLSTKARIGKHVKPIDLAEAECEGQPLPQNCSVAGWGRTDTTNTWSSNILMEANVTLEDLPYCTNDHLYCSRGDNGPAEGDSGGPLVCDGLAHGVVSFSHTGTAPTIHAYGMIPHYRDWIDRVMKGTITHGIQPNEA